jgi:hypothetical protein
MLLADLKPRRQFLEVLNGTVGRYRTGRQMNSNLSCTFLGMEYDFPYSIVRVLQQDYQLQYLSTSSTTLLPRTILVLSLTVLIGTILQFYHLSANFVSTCFNVIIKPTPVPPRYLVLTGTYLNLQPFHQGAIHTVLQHILIS